MKSMLALTLSFFLVFFSVPVYAEEPASSSDVLLSVESHMFSAVVPTQLPVNMSASGVITVAEDVSITNTSKGPIRLDNIEFANVKSDWQLVNFDDDFSSFKVGSKKLAMSFNGDKSLTNGNIVLSTPNLTPIDGLGSMILNYDAKIPAQSVGLVDEVPANVVFTLKWHEVGSADIEESLPNDYEFVPADTKVLTINFKGVTADNDTVTWTSSDEAVATVADHVSKGRARPIDGSKQCLVTAVSSGRAIITGTLKDGTSNSLEIVVTNKNLVNISITTPPIKTSYIDGERFDSTGMIVTANYNNGTSSDISDYIVIDNGDNLTVSQKSVSISYNDKTTTQAITVIDNSLASISITAPPTKVLYVESENFDNTDMIVTARYNNGISSDISDYVIIDGTNLVIGQVSVTINYDGKATTQTISVVPKSLTKIAITTPPTKISYIEGNDFDSAGMEVTAYYNNDTSKIVVPELSRNTNLFVGQTDIDVSYGGQTITQHISVNAKTLANIVITSPPIKVSYLEDNNFDATGMVVIAYYNNGTSAIVHPTLSRNTNLIVGQTSIDVNYGSKTVSQAITVAPKTLTSIAITIPPTKTNYVEANNFDATGMVVTAYYNNGTSTNISDYVIVDKNNLVIGKTSVIISYNGKSITQPITVVAKTLTSIAITTPPTKTNYVEVNNFDATGMVVMAYYNNGTSNVISPTLSRNTNLTTGQTSVDVSFGGKTITQAIIVASKALTNIAITTAPSQTSYIEANNFNSSGMIVTAYYNNGTNGVIAPTFGRNTNLAAGQTSVDVSFGGKTVTQAITVVAKTLTGIAITTQPTKKAYIEGNNFDSTGMVVTATYNNGTTAVVGPTFGRNTNLAAGQTSVDISFGGKTIAQAITVAAKSLSSISIATPPSIRAYVNMDKFSKNGMVVRANYNDGTNAVVTNYTVTNGDRLQQGQTSVTINYSGKTTTQAITVAASQSITVGTKYTLGNYEYSYKQESSNNTWSNGYNQTGWGVRIIDETQINHISPLATIRGEPVTNMSNLFAGSPATTFNFIDWDTSNVTSMEGMFLEIQTNNLDLRGFSIASLTNMQVMFAHSQITSLDISSFDIDSSKIQSPTQIFAGSDIGTVFVKTQELANIFRGLLAPYSPRTIIVVKP